jgi:hypothetical protein
MSLEGEWTAVTRSHRPGSIVRTSFQYALTQMEVAQVQKTLYVRDAALTENGVRATRTSISRAGRNVLLQGVVNACCSRYPSARFSGVKARK